MGVSVSGLGIYGASVASSVKDTKLHLVATVLWMLGEAMADTTTETLIPELLPEEQYDLGSAVRSILFLGGGLTGYLVLMLFSSARYDWLYTAYMSLMIICAFPTTLSIVSDAPSSRQKL